MRFHFMISFASASLLLSGCLDSTDNRGEGLRKRATVPALNAWIAALDTLHRVHVLIPDKKYFDPDLTLLASDGKAGISAHSAGEMFELYRSTDRYLHKFSESCVYTDSIVQPDLGPALYISRRTYKVWVGQGEEAIEYTARPDLCPLASSVDTAIARGIVSTPYMLDSVYAIDSKGLVYLSEIFTYYLATDLEPSREKITAIYLKDTPGIFWSTSAMLGWYDVYY